MTDPQITGLLEEILAVSKRNQQLLELLVNQSPDQSWAQPQAALAPQDTFGSYPRVVELLRQDKMIQAIKAYREQTGAGLAEAKSAVEEIQRQLG